VKFLFTEKAPAGLFKGKLAFRPFLHRKNAPLPENFCKGIFKKAPIHKGRTAARELFLPAATKSCLNLQNCK